MKNSPAISVHKTANHFRRYGLAYIGVTALVFSGVALYGTLLHASWMPAAILSLSGPLALVPAAAILTLGLLLLGINIIMSSYQTQDRNNRPTAPMQPVTIITDKALEIRNAIDQILSKPHITERDVIEQATQAIARIAQQIPANQRNSLYKATVLLLHPDKNPSEKYTPILPLITDAKNFHHGSQESIITEDASLQTHLLYTIEKIFILYNIILNRNLEVGTDQIPVTIDFIDDLLKKTPTANRLTDTVRHILKTQMLAPYSLRYAIACSIDFIVVFVPFNIAAGPLYACLILISPAIWGVICGFGKVAIDMIKHYLIDRPFDHLANWLTSGYYHHIKHVAQNHVYEQAILYDLKAYSSPETFKTVASFEHAKEIYHRHDNVLLKQAKAKGRYAYSNDTNIITSLAKAIIAAWRQPQEKKLPAKPPCTQDANSAHNTSTTLTVWGANSAPTYRARLKLLLCTTLLSPLIAVYALLKLLLNFIKLTYSSLCATGIIVSSITRSLAIFMIAYPVRKCVMLYESRWQNKSLSTTGRTRVLFRLHINNPAPGKASDYFFRKEKRAHLYARRVANLNQEKYTINKLEDPNPKRQIRYTRTSIYARPSVIKSYLLPDGTRIVRSAPDAYRSNAEEKNDYKAYVRA